MSTPTARSPTSSLSSSISILSAPHSLDQFPDERIVWGGSNSAVMVSPPLPSSAAFNKNPSILGDDEDFVLISPSAVNIPLNTNAHRRVPSSVSSESSVESLVSNMQVLSVNDPRSISPTVVDPTRKSRKNRRRASASNNNTVLPPPSPPKKARDKQSNGSSPRAARKASGSTRPPPAATPTPPVAKASPPSKQAPKSLGLGERPIVDDISEYSADSSFYDNAAHLMGLVLNSHDAISSFSRLSILQALIVELGVVDSEVALPTTLTSAKNLLRSSVFVNIRDYLATREQGQEALQQIMHKSRSSLIRDLKKKRKHRAPLSWVKDSGLSVLLVSCY